MDRDDVLRLHYFREHMSTDHLDRIDSFDDYIKHVSRHERRDMHVSRVKLSLRDELRGEA